MYRGCTWNVLKLDNPKKKCLNDRQYCEVDVKSESKDGKQIKPTTVQDNMKPTNNVTKPHASRESMDENPWCNRWDKICYCTDDLCNHGSNLIGQMNLRTVFILSLGALFYGF